MMRWPLQQSARTHLSDLAECAAAPRSTIGLLINLSHRRNMFATRAISACLLPLALILTACATPPDGAPLRGGTEATKLGEGRYQVFASINGYTHPATLKGFISRQAQKTAIAEGFQAFEIERAIQPPTVDGWHMAALVSFSKASAVNGPHAYTVSAEANPIPTPFGTALDLKRSAKLTGFSRRDGLTHWESFMPLFLDTVDVDHNPLRDMSGGLTAAILSVPAGEQVIVVQARVNRGFGGGGPWTHNLPITATLNPGGDYIVTGAVVNEDLEVWVEDRSTGAPVSQRSRTKLQQARSAEIPLR
jgi:hypothetical protein